LCHSEAFSVCYLYVKYTLTVDHPKLKCRELQPVSVGIFVKTWHFLLFDIWGTTSQPEYEIIRMLVVPLLVISVSI